MLKLENAQGLLRKISINVLSQDADNTRFTLPIEGVALSREQVNAYLGDRTFESWFDKRKDGVYVPMDWVARLPKGEIVIADEFETDGVEIMVSGKKALVFESVEPGEEDEDDEGQPAGRITAIVLTPKPGGVVLLAFHLQVAPGFGKENLALQEHQFRHVTITFADLAAIQRKAKQPDLPLGEQAPAPKSGNGQPAGAH